MNKEVAFLISGVIMATINMYMWYKLHDENVDFKNYKTYVTFIIITFLSIFNYRYMPNYLKFFIITFCFVLLNLFLFKRKNNENIFAPVVTQLVNVVSEFILMIVVFIIFRVDAETALNNYFGTITINIIIALLSFLIINMKWPKKLFKFLIKVTDNISTRALIISFCLIVISANFFLATPYYKLSVIYIVIINSIMIIIYSFIVFKLLEEKNKYIKINNKYNMTTTTLKELEQNITRLKITNHENKNQLLTIRNMIKSDEKVLRHIDKIIDEKIKDDESLVFKTSTIMNNMIAAIVYSKLLTMKEKNIDVNLLVDRDVKKTKISDLDEDLCVEACKIIGVYLDNAIEEVELLDKKQIGIEVYPVESDVYISISNNYKSEIDVDLMDKPGYTIKPDGHGYGLSLVKQIIDENDNLSFERKISNEIFTQILKIKM